jgi:hypothetical protein
LIENYGLVLMSVGSIGLVQYGLGIPVMNCRSYFSSPEFLNKPEVKLLLDEHKKEFSSAINKQGYPDTGSGRYSQLLPYKQWVEFNNAQRSHANMIEGSGPVLACIIVSGLYNPVLSSAAGFLYAASRIVYSIGYNSKKGADARLVGAILGALSSYFLYGFSIYSGFRNLKF